MRRLCIYNSLIVHDHLLMNLTTFSRYHMQQFTQHMRYFTNAPATPALAWAILLFFSRYSSRNLTNWIRETTKEPRATEPRWYLSALQTTICIGWDGELTIWDGELTISMVSLPTARCKQTFLNSFSLPQLGSIKGWLCVRGLMVGQHDNKCMTCLAANSCRELYCLPSHIGPKQTYSKFRLCGWFASVRLIGQGCFTTSPSAASSSFIA